MALDITGILDAAVSHALSTGHFLSINEHESKQSNTSGITGEVWVHQISPIKSSGLSNTSVRVELRFRIYGNTAAEPYDDIDTNITLAVDALFTNYIGDFQMFGTSRHIDIFGAYGQGLEVSTGYLNKDGREFRVFQIRLPVIVDDVWAQAA